ncbi:UNVERIFIED_CONTAM: Dnai1 [Trichonephila clavipes]
MLGDPGLFANSPVPYALQIFAPPPTISVAIPLPPSVLVLPVLVREGFSLKSLTLFLFFVFSMKSPFFIHHPPYSGLATDSNDLTKRHQQGCVCVFSLKCPSYPEKVIPCKSGVYCVEFNKEWSYLLTVGLADGTVAVYDLRRNTNSPIAINKTLRLEHNDMVNQVKWLPDNIDGQHNFCSISADCRVISWLLAKSELIPSEVINLRQNDMTTKAPEGNHMNSMSCGTSISFSPDCSDMFLIGTENGFIHKCCNLSNAQYLDAYKDHNNIVYNVHWNPYHPRVFLSCSADWTIRIWDHTLR